MARHAADATGIRTKELWYQCPGCGCAQTVVVQVELYTGHPRPHPDARQVLTTVGHHTVRKDRYWGGPVDVACSGVGKPVWLGWLPPGAVTLSRVL